MRKRLAAVLAVVLAVPLGIKAQASDDATGAKPARPANDQKDRCDAMAGIRWLRRRQQ